MAKLDYTKGLDVPSHKKTWPRPVAYGLLAGVGVAISFGVAGVLARADEVHRSERAIAKPPASAPAAVAPAAGK